VPLLRVRGARQQAYATASVLAIESAIAEVVAKGTATLGAPTVPPAQVEEAMLGTSIRVGRPLTAGQEAAVRGICSDGRRVSLILGVAGSGKTTAIRCVAEAYAAADIAGAKVVLVGDHRQLDAVGPGGAFRAVLNRHHGQVHVLSENVRQDDPGERQALAELRAGDVAKAVAWYAEHDRIRIAPD